MTVNDLAGKLERSGYTRSSYNSAGWFAAHANDMQIVSPTGSRVQVQFAHGKISSIVAVAGHSPLQQYQLDPQLLTDLSQNRRSAAWSTFPKSRHFW